MVREVKSKESFYEELAGNRLALVEYGAAWCPPCRVLAPILEELEREEGSRVRVLQVDCDDQPELAGEAGVMSMPTVILYRGGQPTEKLVGLRPKAVYATLIDRYAEGAGAGEAN